MTQYIIHYIDPFWYAARDTSREVAQAIFAIAGGDRTPEKIWKSPTNTEYQQVLIAIENIYSINVYKWGDHTITIDEFNQE